MNDAYSAPWLLQVSLALLLVVGSLSLPPAARAQLYKDCFDAQGDIVPCPGTQPAIWPDRSKAYVDPQAPDVRVVRILGWNLGGDLTYPLVTDYEVVVVPPDGVPQRAGFVVSDELGDLLGDKVPEDGEPLGAPLKYTVPQPVDPTNPHDPAFGVYEVRIYEWAWDELDASQQPVATTTFLHNHAAN